MIEFVRQVAPNLYRGPRPQSPADVLALKEQFRVGQILNLQGDVIEGQQVSAESAWAATAGVDFRHHAWNWLTPPGAIEIVTCVAILQTAAAGDLPPLYFHCHDGVDRTGVLCLAYRCGQGWSFGAAVAELIDDGFHLERYFWWLPIVRATVGK